MKKYIDDYIAKTKKYIENPDINTIQEYRKEHLVQIQFIQHERIVHWFVTMLVCILLFIVTAVILLKPECTSAIPLFILLLGLVIPYIVYYYYIENKTQELYRLYNQLCEKEKELLANNEKEVIKNEN